MDEQRIIPPMHEYQERAVQFGLDKMFVYWDLDMGLGKTRIAIEWIVRKTVTALVIAPPRGIKTTWPDEIEKWAPQLSYRILHGDGKHFGRTAQVYIINYEGLKWLFSELKRMYSAKRPLPFSAMIIDEGHYVKSHRAKRFEMLQHIRELAKNGICILSGTPAPNSLHDLWSQYYLLDRGKRLGKNITSFRNKYFVPRPKVPFAFDIKSPEAETEIHKAVSDITFRLDAKDYLKLPERIDNIIDVKLAPDVLVRLAKLRRDMRIKLEEAANDKAVKAPSAATLSMKLRQVVQGAIYIDEARNYEVIHEEKLNVLKSLVEIANGQGILCSIQFRFELDMILKAFPKAPVIAGGTSLTESGRYIKAWNQGRVPLMLCHPASLSSSVNLQQGSHLLVWYALPWSLEHYSQLNARLHRQGQKNAVIIHHLVAKDTVDEKIVKALQTKQSILQCLQDYLNETTKLL